MERYAFWEKWRNKTDLEKKAIGLIIKARGRVIDAVPHSELVAIYIKGSFLRREMKEGSDVDMVPIVTENSYEGSIFGVNNSEIDPVVVVPLSLWEFKHNKLYSQGNYQPDLRAEPDLFLLKLKEHKIIFGKPLQPKEFPTRTKDQILRDEIRKIRIGYIRAYREGVIDFQPLLKEVFWLIEWEQQVKGKKFEHSFKGITHSIKDREHIIYDALAFREYTQKGKSAERRFVSKLENYLSALETAISSIYFLDYRLINLRTFYLS